MDILRERERERDSERKRGRASGAQLTTQSLLSLVSTLPARTVGAVFSRPSLTQQSVFTSGYKYLPEIILLYVCNENPLFLFPGLARSSRRRRVDSVTTG